MELNDVYKKVKGHSIKSLMTKFGLSELELENKKMRKTLR